MLSFFYDVLLWIVGFCGVSVAVPVHYDYYYFFLHLQVDFFDRTAHAITLALMLL